MQKTLNFIVLPLVCGFLAALSGCSAHVTNGQACAEWEPGLCRERSDDIALSDEDAQAFEAECASRGGTLKPFPDQCDADENRNRVETVGECEYTLEDDVETFTDFYFGPWTDAEAEAHCTGTWLAGRADA